MDARSAGPESETLASPGRIEELRRLERCERALADAYRYHRVEIPGGDEAAQRLARQHLAHAQLLRVRIETLGGTAHPDVDDSWVAGYDLPSLQFGEKQSLATYHDHLLDFDEATSDAIRRLIIPDHAHALELLAPDYERDRDGDI